MRKLWERTSVAVSSLSRASPQLSGEELLRVAHGGGHGFRVRTDFILPTKLFSQVFCLNKVVPSQEQLCYQTS